MVDWGDMLCWSAWYCSACLWDVNSPPCVLLDVGINEFFDFVDVLFVGGDDHAFGVDDIFVAWDSSIELEVSVVKGDKIFTWDFTYFFELHSNVVSVLIQRAASLGEHPYCYLLEEVDADHADVDFVGNDVLVNLVQFLLGGPVGALTCYINGSVEDEAIGRVFGVKWVDEVFDLCWFGDSLYFMGGVDFASFCSPHCGELGCVVEETPSLKES
jgi:hypothetical protein